MKILNYLFILRISVSFPGKSFSRNFTGKVFPNLLISNEGDNAQIDCFVNDEPVPPILWFRNNLMVEETQKITVNNELMNTI